MSTPMQSALLAWYRKHGRHSLPWQNPRSAYRVWVSEVMLQQTQVDTVVEYFHRFVTRFPDVRELAAASVEEVLALWAGLGYYSRARNLHRAAQVVVTEYAGRLPRERDKLQALPGIGRSTAAAIRAQAWNLPDAILDGNVRRVMARVHAVAGWSGAPAVQRRLWQLAEACSDSEHPRDYCQAIMDLGATLCRRSNPECCRCPWRENCTAYAAGNPQDYPAPRPRKTVPVHRRTMPLIVNARGELLMVQRPPVGIWAQMWCLPEWSEQADCADGCVQLLGALPESIDESMPSISHRLTHRHLQIKPVIVRVGTVDGIAEGDGMLWCSVAVALELGLPKPAQLLIKTYGYDL